MLCGSQVDQRLELVCCDHPYCFAALHTLTPIGPQHGYLKVVQNYGKLWQLKDRHRDALMRAGLTRWHIGEIASRIGQIYYEYYTRTSETRLLREACVWYDTIRKRQYFKQVESSSMELVKQLRYYMRFALICILLDDVTKVRAALLFKFGLSMVR